MKAVVRTRYGSPDVLSIREAEKPLPKENEILVRVYATTVNRTDCAILSAKPFIMRFFTGLFRPRQSIPGTDFAGKIEETGKAVTNFKAGERVWGFDDNGLLSQAEYLTLREDKAIAIIPDNISYEQAAASAEGVHYAYNFVNKVKLTAGQKVLLNGATGAIGTAVVQFLKQHDIIVTAVCNTQSKELIYSLGADKIIDYTKEDFTTSDDKYDFIFDAVGKSTFFRCKHLLNKGGAYLSSELGPYSQNLFLALITSIAGGKRVVFPVPSNIKASLEFVRGLLEKEKFIPVTERKYPVEQIAEAYKYVASGKKTGNVILTINSDKY